MPSRLARLTGGTARAGRERLAMALSAAERLAMAPGIARLIPRAADSASAAETFALNAALADADACAERAACNAATAPGAPRLIPSIACTLAASDAANDKSDSAAAFIPNSDASEGRFALIELIVALSCAEALADSVAEPIALKPAAAAAANASFAEAAAESDGNPKAIAADASADAEAEADAAAPAPPAPADNDIANCATAGGKENVSGGKADNGLNCASAILQMQGMFLSAQEIGVESARTIRQGRCRRIRPSSHSVEPAASDGPGQGRSSAADARGELHPSSIPMRAISSFMSSHTSRFALGFRSRYAG